MASIVHIFSGNFKFKLRSEGVGLIWADFPEPTLPGYTSFYLQLSENCEDEIIREIRELDPTILMFLRQLRQINLTVTQADGQVWTQKLWRRDRAADGSLITTLHRGDSISEYIVIKHHALQLPGEDKRRGCSESEVMLAFPISDIERTRRETQSPSTRFYLSVTMDSRSASLSQAMGSTSLTLSQFLLQGDFLLTTNREDIMEIPWNCAPP